MAEKPSEDEIRHAIERSGYLMEQDVASRLEKLGFATSTNQPFVDSDEGKSREIDVSAYRELTRNESMKFSAYLEVLIECKQSSSPFVFFSRNKIPQDFLITPQEMYCTINDYRTISKKENGMLVGQNRGFFHYLGIDKIHYHYQNSEKVIQFCKIDRSGGGWKANHSGLYDSIFLPITKALEFRKSKMPKRSSRRDWNILSIVAPIVVVKGDLFLVRTHVDPDKIEKVDHVTFSRDIYFENIRKRFSVDFVSESKLEEFFLNMLNPFGDKCAELLNNNPSKFVSAEIRNF